MRHLNSERRLGFTLVELLIAIAVLAIVLTLAAPSFREMIEMQRLKSIAAQVVTDVQFARSEAPSRQRPTYISFTPGGVVGMTCYVIHTCRLGQECQCICSNNPGNRCPASSIEIRTVQLPSELGVRVLSTAAAGGSVPNLLRFDPVTGGIAAFEMSLTLINELPPGEAWIETSLMRGGDTAPTLRTRIATTGRPSVCAPASRVTGVPAC